MVAPVPYISLSELNGSITNALTIHPSFGDSTGSSVGVLNLNHSDAEMS